MVTRNSFGKKKLTLVDRFGVYLSLRAIKKNLPQNNSIHLLDLGCGYKASLLTSLKGKIEQGTGIDFKIDSALLSHTSLTFIESSIEEALCQLNPSSFEVITFISALEHVSEPVKILQHCYDLLKKDGVLLINVPTWRGKFFLEFSAFKLGTSPKEEMDDHKMYYDKRDLWPMLVKVGFRPSDIKLSYHKFGLNLFAVVRKSFSLANGSPA